MCNKCEKMDNYCREEKMTCKGCAYEEKGTMIKAKYRIGQIVWIVDANFDHKQVDVYTDEIDGILLDSNNQIWYYLKDNCDDILEEKLILYEDTNTLIKKIIQADNEINLKNKKDYEIKG